MKGSINMEKLAIVNGVKSATGAYTAPDASKFTSVDSLAGIATDENPKEVKPSAYAGESFAEGQLYVGHYDTDANKFVGDLVAVPAFTMPGDATPKDVKAQNGTISAD